MMKVDKLSHKFFIIEMMIGILPDEMKYGTG